MNEKLIVVYHRADFDGLFCREIAKKFRPDATFIGWNFGDEPLPIPVSEDANYLIMDLPIDRVFGLDFSKPESLPACKPEDMDWSHFTWIDHHISAIETHPKDIPGYRINGVAACRLAWQWFYINGVDYKHRLPWKENFIERRVDEPLAVRLAGEYDIFDKRDPNAELFQHGLKSRELTEFDWSQMLSTDRPSIDDVEKMAAIGLKDAMYPDGMIIPPIVHELLTSGKLLQAVRYTEYATVIKEQGFDVKWEGLNFLACNSHRLDIRSQLFESGIKPHHDALLGFTFMGFDKGWSVSMYGVPGKPEIDLRVIAQKYGGGGHKQACGFPCKTLFFLP